MKKILFTVLFLICTSAFPKDYIIVGMGTYKCAKFGQFIEGNALPAKFYIQGYFTALNVTLVGLKGNPKAIPHPDTIVSLVDNYCSNNPDSEIVQALVEVFTNNLRVAGN